MSLTRLTSGLFIDTNFVLTHVEKRWARRAVVGLLVIYFHVCPLCLVFHSSSTSCFFSLSFLPSAQFRWFFSVFPPIVWVLHTHMRSTYTAHTYICDSPAVMDDGWFQDTNHQHFELLLLPDALRFFCFLWFFLDFWQIFIIIVDLVVIIRQQPQHCQLMFLWKRDGAQLDGLVSKANKPITAEARLGAAGTPTSKPQSIDTPEKNTTERRWWWWWRRPGPRVFINATKILFNYSCV